ncbi:MAG: hypothetical protein ACFE89_09560 [Candidatus Hodarchaeota archaeon]
MRVSHQFTLILTVCFLLPVLCWQPVQSAEGYWRRVGYEYRGLYETLPGYSQWIFNHTRGPYDRWIINLTLSGHGFAPTTVLICDSTGYALWQASGSTSQCQLVESVNATLDGCVNLTHYSRWYFILNNTGSIPLYFTLDIAHYEWSAEPIPTVPLDVFSSLSTLLAYFLIICIIIVVIFPCLCNCGLLGRRRNRKRKTLDSDIHYRHIAFLNVTPAQLKSRNSTDDNETHS